MEQTVSIPRSTYRRKLSGDKIQLPAAIVANIGRESDTIKIDGAMVCWYYSREHNRAILSTNSVDNDKLEKVDKVSISGVADDDLPDDQLVVESDVIDQVPGGRVTITKKLDVEPYKYLMAYDEVVLQMIYPDNIEWLSEICVVVFPANMYDISQYNAGDDVL